MSDDRPLYMRMIADIYEMNSRMVDAETSIKAARRELQLILDALPYAEAKSGKNAKLRKRLQRFLGERLAGL